MTDLPRSERKTPPGSPTRRGPRGSGFGYLGDWSTRALPLGAETWRE